MSNVTAAIYYFDQSHGNSIVNIEIEALAHLKDKSPFWLHITVPEDDSTVETLLNNAEFAPYSVLENLFAEETHPRSTYIKDGLLLILRGVNPNANELPSDMVSLRIWMTAQCLITVSRRPILAVIENQRAVAAMESETPVACLINLMWYLFSDIDTEIYNVECILDEVEENIKKISRDTIQESILSVRQQVISFRRYILPQRDAIKRLPVEKLSWLRDSEKQDLKEYEDPMNHYVEYLNAVRERASVLQDRILNRIQEDLNNKMCIVSVIALIFMPASFITGLFGMNIAIPDAYSSKYLFWILMSIITVSTLALFRYTYRRGWLKFS